MLIHSSPTAGDDDAARPLIAVVLAIAAATDRPIYDLAPLYDSLDPDSLDALCEHARERSTPVRVAFSHDGVDVDVRAAPDGELTVDVDPATGVGTPA